MKIIYFPLVYLSKVKRVNQNYIINSILLDDLPMLLIAFSWVSSYPILNSLGILCLVFSFWCIYEYGYYENDLVAEKYEKNPVLSETYHDSIINIEWWQPWIWSLILAISGVFLVVVSNTMTIKNLFELNNYYFKSNTIYLSALAKWICFLLMSRLCFFVYNYVNKQTRIWLYPFLHGSRYFGFLVLTGSNLVGVSILIAHIAARSTSYFVYRYAIETSKDWPKLRDWFLRLLFFLIFISLLSIVKSDISLVFSWQTLALVFWWSKKCRHQVTEIISNIRPIWNEEDRELEPQPEVTNVK